MWTSRAQMVGAMQDVWEMEYLQRGIEYQKRFETEALISSKPVRVHEIKEEEAHRIKTGTSEFDRLMGGGMMKRGICSCRGRSGNWQIDSASSNFCPNSKSRARCPLCVLKNRLSRPHQEPKG